MTVDLSPNGYIAHVDVTVLLLELNIRNKYQHGKRLKH